MYTLQGLWQIGQKQETLFDKIDLSGHDDA